MRPPTQFSIDKVVVGHSPRMRAIFDFVKVVSRKRQHCNHGGKRHGQGSRREQLHHQSGARISLCRVSCGLFSESLSKRALRP